MMIEIERKFLVRDDSYKSQAERSFRMVQGFLSRVPERVVRIRVVENRGYITVKGISNASGMSRFEWEKELSLDEAQQLLRLCEEGMVEKMRYEVRVGKHLFEVDEFLGNHQGLVLAEIELSQENEVFEKPSWLGDEVTGDQRYYNSYLSKVRN